MAAADPLTTKVSTKGQVILPKALRDQRRWGAGTKLLVEDTAEGVLLREAPLFAATTIEQVFGALGYTGKAKSLDQMDAAVRAEALRRARD
ncbi:MAG: AbrB family transcriptional regulator [Sphingomonadales bacterium 32-68-7]|nr:MAG: AbrB family transcriptional regulator [Sphingomonadales bacterium 12-68-11]OYX10585.1 MAG: AbrB family transcriptional regulator [Sphingomonadales bacterium 32-68-7]